MAQSIKLENNTFLDASGVVVNANHETLAETLGVGANETGNEVAVASGTWTSVLSCSVPARASGIIFCGVRFGTSRTGYREVNLNSISGVGGSTLFQCSQPAVDGDPTHISFSVPFSTGANQTTYYINVRQNSGSTINVQARWWYSRIR